MPYADLQIEREDNIAILVLNRPDKRNALSPSLLEEMCLALAAEEQNLKTRVIVITGSGDKAFCAGFDISDIETNDQSTKPGKGVELIENAFKRLRQVAKPVIAMVNGVSMGAGCDLIVNCDFRFVTEDARFAIPPARLGIVYSWEGTLRVMKLVGPSNAKDLFMSGRTVNANEAYDMGLVNRVIPRLRLREETLAYATTLVNAAPLSVWGAKRMVDILNDGASPSAEDLRAIAEVQSRVWQSSDAKEGARAFKEKRRPVFQGQ